MFIKFMFICLLSVSRYALNTASALEVMALTSFVLITNYSKIMWKFKVVQLSAVVEGKKN